MGNDGPGIWVHLASAVTIGSNGDGVSDELEGNIIANNGAVGFNNSPGTGPTDGIRITSPSTAGVRISRNSLL